MRRPDSPTPLGWAKFVWSETLRLFWRWLLDPLNFARLAFPAYWDHWRARAKSLVRKPQVEWAQGIMAGLGFIMGLCLCLTPARPKDATPLVPVLDTYLPHDGRGFEPHHLFGLCLLASALAAIYSLLDWPLEEELQAAQSASFERRRLNVLLRMQQAGNVMGFVYYAAQFGFSVVPHPTWPTPWVGLFFAVVHLGLCAVLARAYVRDLYTAERAVTRREQSQGRPAPAGLVYYEPAPAARLAVIPGKARGGANGT